MDKETFIQETIVAFQKEYDRRRENLPRIIRNSFSLAKNESELVLIQRFLDEYLQKEL